VISNCGKSINSSKIFSHQCAGIIADHSVTGILEYCCNVNITAVHPLAILQQQANTLSDPKDNCLNPRSYSRVSTPNTLFQTDSCNARAIRNETMILEVLEEEDPAVFSQELFNTLSHYFEEILGMAGAGGRPKLKNFTVFTPKMRNASSRVVARLLVTRPSRYQQIQLLLNFLE
jgi:hypothetical protein